MFGFRHHTVTPHTPVTPPRVVMILREKIFGMQTFRQTFSTLRPPGRRQPAGRQPGGRRARPDRPGTPGASATQKQYAGVMISEMKGAIHLWSRRRLQPLGLLYAVGLWYGCGLMAFAALHELAVLQVASMALLGAAGLAGGPRLREAVYLATVCATVDVAQGHVRIKEGWRTTCIPLRDIAAVRFRGSRSLCPTTGAPTYGSNLTLLLRSDGDPAARADEKTGAGHSDPGTRDSTAKAPPAERGQERLLIQLSSAHHRCRHPARVELEGQDLARRLAAHLSVPLLPDEKALHERALREHGLEEGSPTEG